MFLMSFKSSSIDRKVRPLVFLIEIHNYRCGDDASKTKMDAVFKNEKVVKIKKYVIH